MGRDSYIPSSGSNNNQLFATDVAGYSLNYFNDDYKPIDQTNRWTTVTDRFEASKASSNIDMSTTGNSLYNGNIRAMVSTIMDMSNHVMPQATLYGYDQLNRLITTKAWANLNTGTNVWGNTTYAGLYQNDFSYDANGNILTQVRKNDAGTTIDNLTYNYYNSSGKILKNRLYHVDDAVSSGTFTDDIDDMGTFDNTSGGVNVNNNYVYDAEGRLVKDLQEQISSILWRVDGKVAEVQRTGGSTRKNLKFDYDAMGQRIAKHQFDPTGVTWEKSTYYVRDAQGNVLATYEKVNPGTASLKVKERDIYGSSRVGMYTKQVEMIGATTPSSSSFQHETGSRQYELSNHLGNVLAVITDRKRPLDLGDYDFSGDGINDSNTPQSGTADNRVDFYRAELIASTDYSPFGVDLNGRSFSSSSYRYGFNGQEKVDEVEGNSNHYTAQFWEYDPRLGRRWNLDPVDQISISNYAAFRNNPIWYSDPLGNTPTGGDDKAKQRGKSVGSAIFSVAMKGGSSATKKTGTATAVANLKQTVTQVASGKTTEPKSETAKFLNQFRVGLGMALDVSAKVSGPFGPAVNAYKEAGNDLFILGAGEDLYEPGLERSRIWAAVRVGLSALPAFKGLAGLSAVSRGTSAITSTEVVASSSAATAETHSVFRVVSVLEEESVLSTNTFKPAPPGISSYEGKLFWESAENAEWFKNWAGSENSILKVNVNNSFIYENGSDAGRLFYYVSPERLQTFNKAIESVTKLNP